MMEENRLFFYHGKKQVAERNCYELANVLWHYGEDDYGLWQVQLPVYLVWNIFNGTQNSIGDLDEILDGLPIEQETCGTILHFLFPKGGKVVCCSVEMAETFMEEYSMQGSSLRGSRADIREELVASMDVNEFQEDKENEVEMEQ